MLTNRPTATAKKDPVVRTFGFNDTVTAPVDVLTIVPDPAMIDVTAPCISGLASTQLLS